MEPARPTADRKAIEAEASAWIVQLDGGHPSAEDLSALEEWMARSPVHRQELLRLSSLWDDMNVLKSMAAPALVPVRRSRLCAFQDFLQPRQQAFAAALALLAVVAAIGWHRAPDSAAPLHAHYLEYATDVGSHRVVALEDGSRLSLDTDSRVEVDFTARSRRVRLIQGQALFEVSKNPNKPFLVYAGSGLVRAVGTAFSVHIKDADDIDVVVSEGIVDLSTTEAGHLRNMGAVDPPASMLARIRAGQRARFGHTVDSVQSLPPQEIDRQLAWRDGMLRFDGQPLSEVVAEINRYTHQRIVIRDPAIGDLRVGGVFKSNETEGIYEALENGFGLRIEHVGTDLVYLSKDTVQ